MSDKKIIIIAGHYGAGKTNVACNLALHIKAEDPKRAVTLIDLDTVNPYFRAADAEAAMKSAGIRAIIPEYANTNVDLPTIPAEIYSVFLTDETVIFDVGGDDGAVALGVFEKDIKKYDYEMYYVINMYRPLTATPEDTVEVMREIESYSKLSFTGIINNSNLGVETGMKTVADSLSYAENTSKLAGLPLIYNSVCGEDNVPERINNLFLMNNYTKKLF